MAFKIAGAKKTAAKKSVAKKKAPAKKASAKAKAAPKREVEEDTEERGERIGRATTGWGGADELNESGDFVKSLSFKNESNRDGSMQYFLIKFIDDEPYANLRIHWVNERKGKRSFISPGDEDPLSDVGSTPKSEYRFNVAVLTEDDPVLRSYHAGWKIYKKIKALAESRMTAPLSKHFYVLSRTGEKWHEIEYDITKITPDEIAEAYPEFYVPDEEEIEAVGRYDLSDVEKEYSTYEELEEVAAEIVEGEA